MEKKLNPLQAAMLRKAERERVDATFNAGIVPVRANLEEKSVPEIPAEPVKVDPPRPSLLSPARSEAAPSGSDVSSGPTIPAARSLLLSKSVKPSATSTMAFTPKESKAVLRPGLGVPAGVGKAAPTRDSGVSAASVGESAKVSTALASIAKTETQAALDSGTFKHAPTSVARVNPLVAAAKAGVVKKESREADFEFLFKEGPKDFQSLLDGFDESLNRDTGIDDFNVDHLRGYVRTINVELQNQPELDGMMAARDVRNILVFIRSQRERALELGEKKATKAANSKASKPGKAKFDPFGGAGKNLSLNDIPKNVADLGDWDM